LAAKKDLKSSIAQFARGESQPIIRGQKLALSTDKPPTQEVEETSQSSKPTKFSLYLERGDNVKLEGLMYDFLKRTGHKLDRQEAIRRLIRAANLDTLLGQED
jgi:hypothetical protein